MNKSALIGILLLILLALLGALGFLLLGPSRHDGEVACTEEAKLCPDGSSVGRVGPNCEFALCPGVSKIQTLASSTDEMSGTPE